MREYELTFIISPNLDDEGATEIVDRVSGLIQSINGEVASVDVWGRRTLAYPINNYREGTYVLMEAKMPPASTAQFERDLKLVEEVIRHMLINREG